MKNHKKNFWSTIRAFIWPFLWMGVIFFLSAQPVLPSLDIFWGDFILKKTAHIAVFSFLCLLWLRAFSQWKKQTGRKIKHKWFLALLLTLLYACLDEYHQSFVIGRTATARDIGFDSLGAILAILWFYRFI